MTILIHRRHIVRPLMALAVVALTVSSAAARDEVTNDLFERVQKQVLRYPRFTVFDDINVGISGDGHVLLKGHVTWGYKADAIEKRVAGVEGVTAVTNEIVVLPVSPFDDELRYRVARAIYSNSTFWRYGSSVNPPIHIVVDRGRVRLTGVVATETERRLARALANQFGAFSVTNELRLPQEVADEREREAEVG